VSSSSWRRRRRSCAAARDGDMVCTRSRYPGRRRFTWPNGEGDLTGITRLHYELPQTGSRSSPSRRDR
jgi:hypothetical protein